MAASSNLRSSPAARAFFAALDDEEEKVSPNDRRSKPSSFIQKRIQTLGWRNRYSQETHYPVQIGAHHNNNIKYTVLQVQRGEVEGTYGTGATVWPASIVLIKYLARHAVDLLHGRRVVDLGAGTGVTSIAAALLGASHCICTDGEDSVVQLARENIQRASMELGSATTTTTTWNTTAPGIAGPQFPPLNDTNTNAPTKTAEEGDDRVATVTATTTICIRGCPIDVEKYWWGTGSIERAGKGCDVILVSDCVLPKLYPIYPLVEALDQLVVLEEAVAILSYEYRYFAEYDPKDKFVELCKAKNLEVMVIPMEEQDPVYSVDDIEIWHVRRCPQLIAETDKSVDAVS